MCLCVESATVILLEPCKWCQSESGALSESTCIYVNYCKLIGWNEQFTCAHDYKNVIGQSTNTVTPYGVL